MRKISQGRGASTRAGKTGPHSLSMTRDGLFHYEAALLTVGHTAQNTDEDIGA